MNAHGRDATIGLGVCAVIVTALIVTRSLDVLWLLLFLVLVAF